MCISLYPARNKHTHTVVPKSRNPRLKASTHKPPQIVSLSLFLSLSSFFLLQQMILACYVKWTKLCQGNKSLFLLTVYHVPKDKFPFLM